MEGLIPFVLDAIRKSQQHGRGSGYRCVSSDGSSHGGSGSRRRLIDYWELPAAVAPANDGSSSSSSAAMGHRGGELAEFANATDARRVEDRALHARPAAVVAGSAYRRK